MTTSVLLKAVTVTSPKDIVAIAGDTNVANAECIFPIQYRVFRHPGTSRHYVFHFLVKTFTVWAKQFQRKKGLSLSRLKIHGQGSRKPL